MCSNISIKADDKNLDSQEQNQWQEQCNTSCRISDGIFIRQKDYYRKYLFIDMLWIEASGNYSYIHLSNRSKIIVVKQLSQIEPLLPVEMFIRIHRSVIVNINAIDGFIGNQLCIRDVRLSVSGPYRRYLRQCCQILGAKTLVYTR